MSVHEYTCTCCHAVSKNRCLFIKFKEGKYNCGNHNVEASLRYWFVSPYNGEFICRICDRHLLSNHMLPQTTESPTKRTHMELTSCLCCKHNMLTQIHILDHDKYGGNRLVQKIELANPEVKWSVVCDKCFKKNPG